MLTLNEFNHFYPDLFSFSAASTSKAYYYRNQNGKRVRVKKGFRRKIEQDTISGTSAALTSAGFIAGSGIVGELAKKTSSSPWVHKVGYGGGAIAGSVVATILGNIALEKLRKKDKKKIISTQ